MEVDKSFKEHYSTEPFIIKRSTHVPSQKSSFHAGNNACDYKRNACELFQTIARFYTSDYLSTHKAEQPGL